MAAAQIAEPQSMFFMGDRGFAIVDRDEPGQDRPSDLAIWDLSDPARPYKVRLLKDAATGRAVYVPSSHLYMHDAFPERTQLWDMRDIRKPRKADLLPAASGGYLPVGKGVLATTLTDGTVQFWDVSNPYKARKTGAMRFGTPSRTSDCRQTGSGSSPVLPTASGIPGRVACGTRPPSPPCRG
ncbi:hypothetical protein ACFQ2K_06195 [Streptomyces sanglieri]|uniref:Uncharacterized protein n=1 Tax=Streptomyces sanglieri TaxID=193460 RepID=A0ABW2WKC7_9ACTN